MQLADVQAFIDSLASLKASSRTRAVAALKSCLSFAVKTGYLQFNVGAAVKLPKGENRLAERIMSEQAVARMLAKEEHPRNHAILALLYRAGLRAQEVCTLQWRHVQPRDEAGQLAIYGKGKKTRFVLLDQGTWDEVQALRPLAAESDAYVFQSRQRRSRRRDEPQAGCKHDFSHRAHRRRTRGDRWQRLATLDATRPHHTRAVKRRTNHTGQRNAGT